MIRICNDNFDLNYEHITLKYTIKNDKINWITISLEEGVQFPDRVAPRIKVSIYKTPIAAKKWTGSNLSAYKSF